MTASSQARFPRSLPISRSILAGRTPCLRSRLPEIFTARNVGPDQLPPASGPLLPLDEAGEADRATRVGQQFGKRCAGYREIHDGCVVPRRLAAAGLGAARPEP